MESEAAEERDGERRRFVWLRKSFRQREGCLRMMAGPESMAEATGVAVGKRRMTATCVGEW